ncbi:MAG: hypothetical protein Q9M91_06690 [Candidatus Dojkabacteria bacterium]|nr:hypothetical protein [Candidatus Dojkabacteria bacterium]MDQ7021483.1 hypothetical protein [Candidatus Dojkabacteria bacterium]
MGIWGRNDHSDDTSAALDSTLANERSEVEVAKEYVNETTAAMVFKRTESGAYTNVVISPTNNSHKLDDIKGDGLDLGNSHAISGSGNSPTDRLIDIIELTMLSSVKPADKKNIKSVMNGIERGKSQIERTLTEVERQAALL